MADHDEVAAIRLRAIADALGVPVEQLRHPIVPRELADSRECIRLWYKLRTDEGRSSVLDSLRAALAKESG